MAASEDEFLMETFLHGCFSKPAADLYSFYKFLHIFYISCFDVMLKRNGFLRFFLSKCFGEKGKHTELALNFVIKQNFS